MDLAGSGKQYGYNGIGSISKRPDALLASHLGGHIELASLSCSAMGTVIIPGLPCIEIKRRQGKHGSLIIA